ncbi:MAG: hypothetical protein V4692_04815 [Bdellovibrionota bacterium]
MIGFHTALAIYKQLKCFGLDWREWTISKLEQNEVVQLSHRDDPEFRIQAKMRQSMGGNLHMHSLSIISL